MRALLMSCRPVGAARRFVYAFVIMLTLTILGASSSLLAERATVNEMDQVAANWLTFMVAQDGGWNGSDAPTLAKTSNLMWEDTLLARVYTVAPQGFVVVPVMKELAPVKIYSTSSSFDATAGSGPVQMVRENLIYQMRLFIQNYGSIDATQPTRGNAIFTREERAQWDRFAVDTKTFSATLSSTPRSPLTQVGPLVKSEWHQSEPFNLLCPMGDSGRCVVGCVATTMAQLMNYWKCPTAGIGAHSYHWNGDQSCQGGSHTPGADFSVTLADPYDWANMRDTVTMASPAATKAAVEELSWEAGVTVNMMYGSCSGSGAYSNDVPGALISHFRYENSMINYNRTAYTAAQWFSIIQTELNASRPIYYRITSHAFVCDGWNNTGGTNRYHMNYGWEGGYCTAWYAVDNYYCDWGCTQSAEGIWTHIQPKPDFDDDGIPNATDNCPLISNVNQADADQDGVGDVCDNCLNVPNHSQTDTDGDGIGDACDPDIDGDGLANNVDNCDFVVNPGQEASDSDSLGDACDNCPTVPNNDQYDENNDGIGDACDGLVHIHIQDLADTVSLNRNFEYFFHAVGGSAPYTWTMLGGDLPYGMNFEGGTSGRLYGKPNYMATYYFTITCDDATSRALSDTVDVIMTVGPATYVCGDADNSGSVDISDAVYLIAYIFSGGPAPNPLVAGDANCDSAVDISDAVYLIAYIFSGGPAPCKSCK
jgi:hypothetical protein